MQETHFKRRITALLKRQAIILVGQLLQYFYKQPQRTELGKSHSSSIVRYCERNA
jgi:hypothetical protein